MRARPRRTCSDGERRSRIHDGHLECPWIEDGEIAWNSRSGKDGEPILRVLIKEYGAWGDGVALGLALWAE